MLLVELAMYKNYGAEELAQASDDTCNPDGQAQSPEPTHKAGSNGVHLECWHSTVTREAEGTHAEAVGQAPWSTQHSSTRCKVGKGAQRLALTNTCTLWNKRAPPQTNE